MKPGIECDSLVFDLLDGMPLPELGRFGRNANKVSRVGEGAVRQDRGEMFKGTCSSQFLQGRSGARQGDAAPRAFLEPLDIVASSLRLPVEGRMLSRMHRFLEHEMVDLAAERLRGGIVKISDRGYEEFFTQRER